MKRVYIIILNWNGWQDTIECLESVFRLDYPEFRVVVCDNDSRDGSLENIKSWAEGKMNVDVATDNPLRYLTFPPVTKPITYTEYDRSQAEAGGRDGSASMILIRTGANLGFAGGNNVGMRYALARGDFDYVWLLNNDTIIKPDALSQMVQRMEEKPDAGMCGALIPFYKEPDKIWIAGGATLNNWLGKAASIDCGKPVSEVSTCEDIEARINYIAGASMLVSADFLRSVGMMSDDYFLYFEEPDWYIRGKERYSLAYADKAIVYHKVGNSTVKCNSVVSKTAEEFCLRSQLRFMIKFFPYAVPLVLIRIAIFHLKLICLRLIRAFTKSHR
jgi:GT2 family glycosyltransferase